MSSVHLKLNTALYIYCNYEFQLFPLPIKFLVCHIVYFLFMASLRVMGVFFMIYIFSPRKM